MAAMCSSVDSARILIPIENSGQLLHMKDPASLHNHRGEKPQYSIGRIEEEIEYNDIFIVRNRKPNVPIDGCDTEIIFFVSFP